MINILKQLSAKPFSKYLTNYNNQTSKFHASALDMIKLSNQTNAEPVKAKRRIDPALLAIRENRKRRKFEKEIKRMEKFGSVLKPIEELEPDKIITKEVEFRNRNIKPLNKEETNDEYFLNKEWNNYLKNQHRFQMEQIERALKSQELALNELKSDNLNLYNMAIQVDTNLVPFMREGPLSTPPNKMYEPPEGDYYDNTFLYDRT